MLRIQKSHPWKCSRPCWMKLWATRCSERSPSPQQGFGTRCSLRSFLIQTFDSVMSLWFSWHKIRHLSVAPLRECHKYFIERYSISLFGLIFAKYMHIFKAKYSQEKVKIRVGFHLFSPSQSQPRYLELGFVRQLNLQFSLQKCYVLLYRSCGLTASLAFTLISEPCSNQSVSLQRKNINMEEEKQK